MGTTFSKQVCLAVGMVIARIYALLFVPVSIHSAFDEFAPFLIADALHLGVPTLFMMCLHHIHDHRG